jgi:hypothetical protein
MSAPRRVKVWIQNAYGTGGEHVITVPASDYDTLRAANQRLEGEVDRWHKLACDHSKAEDRLSAKVKRLEGENKRLREALETVSMWMLPRTGQHWPSGGEMSYGACHGSNGERDYMRRIADAALRGNGGE